MSRLRSKLRAAGPWLGLWCLNALLFVPGYVFSVRKTTFFPHLSAHALHGSELFGLRAYASMLLRRENPDLFRVSLDFGLLVLLLIATANLRGRAVVRALLGTLYFWLALFLGYHNAVAYFFERKPALGEDWRFLLNLGHFLGSVMSPGWAAILVAFALSVVGLAFAVALTFRALQLRAAGWPARRRLIVAGCFLAPCFALIAWLGVTRDQPVVQIVSKRVVYNWRASVAEAERLAELHERTPDRRYDPFLGLTLERKPNFYLLMIEAYGEILATWDMDEAYRALLARVEARLARAGYHARSTYSAAPVHSGTSWFSISTLHTGTLIDRPLPYAALQLVGARVPSLTRFFAGQGYRTYTLQPGSSDHAGLKRLDVFNHDVVVDAPALGYEGWQYGWGMIPDQYSWGVFRSRWFAKPAEPYYVYYMSVSTHWAWEGVPPYVRDFRSLAQYDIPAEHQEERWPPIPGVEKIGSELRREYFRSVEYEWRVLLDVLEADRSPDIVVAIVGDHQPRLESGAPGEVTMNSPVHMLSRDAAFIERFAEQGFQPGLYAKPSERSSLWHEGLFSLWVSKLAAAYGAPGSRDAGYYPRGIRLSTLSR